MTRDKIARLIDDYDELAFNDLVSEREQFCSKHFLEVAHALLKATNEIMSLNDKLDILQGELTR